MSYCKIWKAVRTTSALLVLGITAKGLCEVLGLRLGDSELEGTWTDLLTWLQQRGLSGEELLVSDDHAGLVQAAQRHFQGVLWQRCQVHLGRNVLGRTPRPLRAHLAAGPHRIFQAEDHATARAAFVAAAAALVGKADHALAV